MTEELIVRHCSPTLAGLKTANMFSCPYEDQETMLKEIRKINRCLEMKGLRLIPLKLLKNRMLLYLYRPERLKEDLSNESAIQILKERGYQNNHFPCCIVKLIQKMQQQEEFPHEVGLFLGYPPEDVQGFIDNKACKCKCSGCWKVYGDEVQAKKTFETYKKCTEIYCAQWERGKTLENLAVAG